MMSPSSHGSRPWMLAFLGLALTAGLAGVGWWYWRGPTPAMPELHFGDDEPRVVEVVNLELARVRAQPRSGEAWGRLGKILFAHGMNDPAMYCFVQAERFEPSEPRWPYYQGLHLMARDPDRSEVLLRKSVRLCARTAPDNLGPRLRLVELLLAQGKLDEAEQELEPAIALEPAEPRVRFYQGLLARQREQWQEALRLLLPLRSHPLAGRLVSGPLAMIYRRLGQPAEAEKFGRLTIGLGERDLLWPDEFVGEYAGLNFGRERTLGRLYEDTEGAGENLATIQALIRESGGRDHRAYIVLGNALMHRRQYGEAITAFRRSLALKPNQYRALYLLSLSLLAHGENLRASAQEEVARSYLEDATTRARQALAIEPNDALASYQLGRCLMVLGRHREALEPMSRAVKCRPENARFHCYLAEIQAELSLKEQARQSLARGLKIAGQEDAHARQVARRVEARLARE